MTKPKAEQRPREPEQPKLVVEWVALDYIQHLKAHVERLQKDVDFYRGKSERLELAIMNSDTKREAAVEFVERTDEKMPSIRNAVVDTGKTSASGTGAGFKTKFDALKEKWDKLSPAEQARQQGLPVEEEKPVQV